MSNSKLFTDAHKMTKMEVSMSQRNVALTIQPNETYRYKFGQWLVFLKTGITNVLRLTNINQSVCYVPILNHDRESKIVFTTPFKVSKVTTSQHGRYVQEGIKPERNQRLLALNIDTMIISFMLALLDSKLFISLVIIMQFMLVLHFV